MELLAKVLAWLVGGGAVAIAVYLGKTAVEALVARNVKALEGRFNQDLKLLEDKLGRERDGLNADLRVQAFMRETRYARLATRQAETLEQLYARLWDIQAAAYDITKIMRWAGDGNSDEDEQKRVEKYNSARDALSRFLRKRGLYLTPDVFEMVENYWKTVNGAVMDWHLAKTPGMVDPKKWMAAVKDVEYQGEGLIKQIAARMQAMLGVTQGESTKLPATPASAELSAAGAAPALPPKMDDAPNPN